MIAITAAIIVFAEGFSLRTRLISVENAITPPVVIGN